MDKLQLRKELRLLRDAFSVDYKSLSDKQIAEFLFSTEEYSRADVILTYVSVGSEVDTSEIIGRAIADGKKVAVPHCCDGFMNFYLINSVDNLVCSQFGVPTVDVSESKLAEITYNTLCIVPGLSFDSEFNRIGYGGGYYDRFLTSHKVKTAGLCREESLLQALPVDENDVKIDLIITEESVSRRRFNNGK